MMPVNLHPTPRDRDVVLEQIRIVGLGLRREMLIAAAVLCIVTLTIVIKVVRGGAGIHFDSWDATSIIALLFPFAVWKREKRFGPAFLWTLPVDRRRLALAKVFAGWVWLMTALAVYILWLLALALLPSATVLPVTLVPFTAATAMYLLGSALVLGLRHPLRCLLATVGVLFLLYILNYYEPYGSGLWRAPAAFLWLGAGLAALWAAISRHRENR